MRPLLVHLVLRRQQSLAVSDASRAALIERCDRTLVEALEQRPESPCALHLPGHILESLDKSDAGLIDRLADLVRDERIELLGGGFYSPVLSVLPWRDAIGQLEMMAGYLERRTGRRPRGAWLTDCVWTPRLAEVLADGGARYTLLEAPQLRAASSTEGELAACYATEHVGRPLGLLPIDLDLSRLAAGPSAPLVAAMRRLHAAGAEAVTLVLDVGALAGLAGHHVGQLLDDLAAEHSWLTLCLPSSTVDSAAPRQRIYVPESAGEAAGSGLWQRWLAADGQADRMHKRMIEVSRRFAALERVIRNQGWRAMSQLTRPRRALYRGQNAAAYVADGPDGLHDPGLRQLVLGALIEAEVAADALVRGEQPYLEVSLRDLYARLDTEILLRNRHLRAVFRPGRGGCLAELEHLGTGTAVLNALSRRHAGGTVGAPVASGHHDRGAFHDRFLSAETGSDRWLDGHDELGDLVRARYHVVGLESDGRGATEQSRISLAAEGQILHSGGQVGASLIKEIALGAPDEGLSVKMALHLHAPLDEALHWCVEFNLNPVAEGSGGTLRLHDGQGRHYGLQGADRVDLTSGFALMVPGRGLGLDVRSDRKVCVDWAPLTVASPGHEPRWQGLAVLLRLAIPAGEQRVAWTLRLQCIAAS